MSYMGHGTLLIELPLAAFLVRSRKTNWNRIIEIRVKGRKSETKFTVRERKAGVTN